MSAPPAAATPRPDYTAAVLSPLYEMSDPELDAFEKQLATLKANGVTAVETDLWWGLFERGVARPAAHDWSYYLKLAKKVNAAGLRWIPILSFHECGPNPGDSCRGYGPGKSIPIPEWVDDELKKNDLSLNACAFVNEAGLANTEYIAPWCDDVATDWYEAATVSFAANFAAAGVDIQPGTPGAAPGRGPRTELGAWTAEFCTPMTAGPPNGDGSIPFSTSVHLSADRFIYYKYRVVAGGVVGRWELDPDEPCDVKAVALTCNSMWNGT